MHVQRACRRAAAFLALVLASGSPLDAQEPTPPIPSAAGERLWQIMSMQSPELLAARRGVEAARARLNAAGFGAPAVLGLETEDPDGIDITQSGIRVEVSREFLGSRRRTAERGLAAAAVRLAEIRLASTERALRGRLGAELARLAGWSAAARRLAGEDSLFIATEEALRTRFSVGEARYTDVLRLRTERLRTQSERAAALANVGVARTSIETLTGGGGAEVRVVIDEALRQAPAGAVPAPPSLDSLIARSPVLALVEAEVQRVQAEQALVRAERGGRIEAGIGAQVMSEADRRTIGPIVSAQVSLPFTARRSNTAQDQAAVSVVRAAEARRDATIAGLVGRLRTALTRYDAARARYDGYDSALLRGARDEREAALSAYQAGELSLVELLDFERALARAELDRILAQIEAAESLNELYAAGAVTSNDSTNETLP